MPIHPTRSRNRARPSAVATLLALVCLIAGPAVAMGAASAAPLIEQAGDTAPCCDPEDEGSTVAT
jgi:hypothetical protein